MTYDWNSFYGTFAQSAGAIIGIIAAFVISRLLGLSDKVAAVEEEFNRLLRLQSKLTYALSQRNFEWYNEQIINESISLERDIKMGLLRDYDDSDILMHIYNGHDLFKDDIGVLEAYRRKVSDVQNVSIEALIFNNSNSIWDDLNAEKDKISNLRVEVTALISDFEYNNTSALLLLDHIKPLYIVTVMLLIAFPITVVYPLHFLPLPVNEQPQLSLSASVVWHNLISLKGLLLLIFFLIFQGTFLYFLITLVGVKKRMWELFFAHTKQHSDIRNYSSFLEDTIPSSGEG